MDGYLLVLALAALPAAGNLPGGLLAEAFEVSRRILSLALHLAAGIVLGVVGLELMPRALETDLPWAPLLAFVVGGALFLGLERLVGYAKGRLGGDDDTGPPGTASAGASVAFRARPVRAVRSGWAWAAPAVSTRAAAPRPARDAIRELCCYACAAHPGSAGKV